jgi:hypothetical protein
MFCTWQQLKGAAKLATSLDIINGFDRVLPCSGSENQKILFNSATTLLLALELGSGFQSGNVEGKSSQEEIFFVSALLFAITTTEENFCPRITALFTNPIYNMVTWSKGGTGTWGISLTNNSLNLGFSIS